MGGEYFPIFGVICIQMITITTTKTEHMVLESVHLGREVTVDFYLAGMGSMMGMGPERGVGSEASLLLINDGQELGRLGLAGILEELDSRGSLTPLLCVGIHAGVDRKMEYGSAGRPDFQGWGKSAGLYSCFVLEELIPAVRRRYAATGVSFREKAFAGFSLGALSAMDIVWRHPQEFRIAGLFSGSFWWRTRDKADPAYDERRDRIMHDEVRNGGFYPWLKFFFECGTADEQEDRNHNGVIDSIDDTQDLIGELELKGYVPDRDIRYLEIADGRHDVATWAKAMPEFLLWGWARRATGPASEG